MNRLGDQIDQLASAYDSNKGERSACKERQGRRDRDDEFDDQGQGSGGQIIPREGFLALKLAPPFSLRHGQSSSRGRGYKKSKKETTRAIDGHLVDYIPYEEGSGKWLKNAIFHPFGKTNLTEIELSM